METGVLIFLLIGVACLAVVYVSVTIGFLTTGVPFISSKKDITSEIFKNPLLKNKNLFIDLGSGDGRFVRAAVDAGFQKGVGFESALWPLLLSKVYSRKYSSKVAFFKRNFFHTDWSEADVLFAYTSPKAMISIEEKFLKESKNGAILISNAFMCPNIKPVEHKKIEKSDVYYYLKKF